MERSDPIHWTVFIWIGPVPEEEGGDVVKKIYRNKGWT